MEVGSTSIESHRTFEFDDIKVNITEILTTDISGKIEQHGAHLWPAAPVLAAAIARLYPKDIGGDVIELGCGVSLPGIAAATRSSRVLLTDGFESGLTAAKMSIETNKKQIFCNESIVSVHKLRWNNQSEIDEVLAQSPNLKLVIAADCLYPDLSNWPSFFFTLFALLNSNSNCHPKALIAFHKRNSFQTFQPFLDFWKLKARLIPLSCMGLDLEDNIGGTKLPGPNTGSVQLYEIAL